MKQIKSNSTLTKCVCIIYNVDDLKRCIDFCLKHLYNYYYIKHKPDDEEIKEHYHFIIESNYQHRFNINTLLSDTFKINLFQYISNVDSYLRYMTHIDYDDKEHYSSHEIISNVPFDTIDKRINKVLKTPSEISNGDFNLLCSLIIAKELTNIKEIIIFCMENNIVYKPSWTYVFKELLKC